MAVIEAVLVPETWATRNLEVLILLAGSVGVLFGVLIAIIIGLVFDYMGND